MVIFQVSNYELGVIFPLHSEAEADKFACFERPPRKYSSSDRPWVRILLVCFSAIINMQTLTDSRRKQNISNLMNAGISAIDA
jgi:hypothetical protein